MTRFSVGLLVLLMALPAWAERAVVSSPKGANVYAASGRKAKKTDLLPKSAEVETLEERNGRVHVRFQGGEGWVARDTLRVVAKKELPAEVRNTPAPAAVPRAEAPGAVAAEAVPTPMPAPAVSPPAAPAPTDKPAGDSGYLAKALKEEPIARVETGPSFVSVIGSLLVVLALVAGAVYLVKILSARRLGGVAKSRGIQVLATRPLGPRQALLLVEVGGLPLLLAQGDGLVNLIAEIRDPGAVNRLNDLYGFRETPFENELRSRLDLEGAPEGGEPSVPGGELEAAGLSPEDRLAALRRRRRPGEDT